MGIGLWQYSSTIPSNLLFLSESIAPSPTKCFSLMPKWCLDVNRHEVNRGARLTNDKHLHYMAYTLVNRTGLFQEELYLPFPGNKPNNTHDEWLAGNDKPAIMDKLTEDGYRRRSTVKMSEVLANQLSALGLGGGGAAGGESSEDEDLQHEMAQLRK